MRVSKVLNNKPKGVVKNNKQSKSHSGNRLRELSFDKSRALLSFGSEKFPIKTLSKPNNVEVKKLVNSYGYRYITQGDNLYGFIKNNKSEDFDIKILDGKHGTSVLFTPKDEKYKNLNILLTKGSKIINKGASVVIEIPPVNKKEVSFKGKFFASVGKTAYADKMENAYDEFFNQGIKTEIEKMYKPDNEKLKDDYNFFTPTDGLGTRLGDVTYAQGGISKPAVPLPAKIAGKDYRLIHNTLSTFTKTGLLNEGYETIKVNDAKGSAYALLKGIKEGTIGIDKPLVMTWGDAFSDLELKEVLKEHESRGDAGLTVVCIPVDKKDIKGFAAVGLNEKGQVKKLVEKPDTLEEAAFSKIEGTDKYLGSVGPYILSKGALRWIKKQADEDMDYFYEENKGYDFSSKILAPLVYSHGKNWIEDDNGMPLKMYTHTTDCNWSDIGSTSEFIEKMHDIKKYYSHYDLPKEVKSDIRMNTTKEGPVFLNDSKNMFNNFCQDYGISVKGNVIVSIAD